MFLNHLHDVFFLQGAKSSNKCVDDFELKWGAVLPDGFLADNNTYVLAMALVTVHKNENQEPQWVKIELIESFVPHFGVAQRLMFKLRQHFELPLFPNNIVPNQTYFEKKKISICSFQPVSKFANSDYYRFGSEHIEGFDTLFNEIYLHEPKSISL